MFNNQRHIQCSCDPDTWILTPNIGTGPNITTAVIDMRDDPIGGKTGTLSFSGRVKAFLTLDDCGRVITYTLTDSDASSQMSVENILANM